MDSRRERARTDIYRAYTPTPEDILLREVCGDWVHTNDSRHLSRGVTVNVMW